MRPRDDTQFDLFAGGGIASSQAPESVAPPTIGDPAALSDSELLAAIPDAGIPLVLSLIDEAGRRKLQPAIPFLDKLCRLFAGFGVEREVAEQAASLAALASIGGRESRSAISGLLADGVIQGPTLKLAARAAVTLQCRLPAETVLSFLNSSDPEMRVAGCHLTSPRADMFAVLLGLLADPERNVRASAACALGRHGRHEARPALKNMLLRAPTASIVEAIAPVADEECIVIMGRLARDGGSFAQAAREALSGIDHPLAITICGPLGEREDWPKD